MNQNISCLKGLQPERVWHYFGEISQIPHGSGNMEAISDYCVQFAKKKGLSYHQDEHQNVVIWKPASAGAENVPVTILQGHLDMVCEQEQGAEIDMGKEGLKLYREGDYISAKQTTLGGDDGIAIAMILAVLEDDALTHPALEAVFTTNEEIGMLGAQALDKSLLKGKYLLNLDSEQEGSFLCGCAGGAKLTASLPLQTEERTMECWLKLTVTGCVGGHSGLEIDKERANAIVLLGEALHQIDSMTKMQLWDCQGGGMDNAIPRNASALIGICQKDKNKVKELLEETCSVWKREFSRTETGIEIIIEEMSGEHMDGLAYGAELKKKLLFFLAEMPNGIAHFSMDIPGMPETSLNAGILKTGEENVSVTFCIRSMVDSRKKKLCEKIRILTEHLGGDISISGDYPGWDFKEESALRNCLCEVYEKQYGARPEILIEHAGVECGLFIDAAEGREGVSLGPDILNIHTPKEKMSVSSVERVYQFLIASLRRIAE